jgi:hypothetical protein
MSFQGRSLDDLPLAAYSTGIVPDEDESLDPPVDPDLVPPPKLTQQDLAAALADAAASTETPPAKPQPLRVRRSMKIPSLRRGKAAALQQAAPFQPVSAGGPPASSFQAVSSSAVSPSSFEPVASFQAAPFHAAPAFEPVGSPALAPAPGHSSAGAVRPRPRLALPMPELTLRDPRVLAAGVVVVGLAVLGFSLLGGGPATGSPGSDGNQNPGAIAPTAAPGAASVELTTALKGAYTLTGATGAGPAVGGQLNATWTDPFGDSLALTGLASSGTRWTDGTFVLTWTMLIGNQLVTFTSRDAECTIGMAVSPFAVHGTFVCKKLKSVDGDHVIDFKGSYTT